MEGLSEPKMITFILQHTEHFIHYFGPYGGLSKLFLKKLLELWGSADEAVRIVAFLNIRAMALKLPYPYIANCLKVRSPSSASLASVSLSTV